MTPKAINKLLQLLEVMSVKELFKIIKYQGLTFLEEEIDKNKTTFLLSLIELHENGVLTMLATHQLSETEMD